MWGFSETNSDIRFTSWGSDGTIDVIVNGKIYKYNTYDGALNNTLRRTAKYHPGKAFNQILNMVR